MAIPRVLILDDADLTIDGETLACVTTHLELTPDVSVVTLTTLCGEVDVPGTIKWSLIATLYQSFDPAATEEILSSAVDGGVPVAFEIIPRKSEPVSATNPSWSGMVIPMPYSPVNGDAGSESTVELEWSVQGEPVKSVVPGTARAGAAKKETVKA